MKQTLVSRVLSGVEGGGGCVAFVYKNICKKENFYIIVPGGLHVTSEAVCANVAGHWQNTLLTQMA